MKSIILLLALLLSHASFAEVISEDHFQTDIQIKPTDMRCSFFGKLRMKVQGLEEQTGEIGTGWLEANRLEANCMDALNQIKDQVNSGNNNFAAEVDLVKIRFQRQTSQRTDYNAPGYGRYRNLTRCHVEEITNLTVTLPGLQIADKALVLKASQTRIIEIGYGHCGLISWEAP